jgi:hypothetical protein
MLYSIKKDLSSTSVNSPVWLLAASWIFSQAGQMSNKEQGLQKVVNPPSQQSYMISIKIRSISNCWLPIMMRSTTDYYYYYYYAKVSSGETNIIFSISLCPVESLCSSTSLWKRNFILHSWQIHIAFRSSGCMYIDRWRCILTSLNLSINQSSS